MNKKSPYPTCKNEWISVFTFEYESANWEEPAPCNICNTYSETGCFGGRR